MTLNDTIASEALAAAAGGAISSGVLYPLEVLKTRMQADDTSGTVDESNAVVDGDGDEEDEGNGTTKNESTNTPESAAASSSMDYARNLYRDKGMSVFFDGMEVSAFQSAVEKACYFFAYTALKRSYVHVTTRNSRQSGQTQRLQQQQISALSSVLLGCLAEWVHLPITLPLDALTTAIQTSGGSKKSAANSLNDKIDDPKTHSVLALWMTLWKEKSFYKGIQAYWILCFKPALQYTIFEQIKAWVLRLRRIRGATKGRLQLSTEAAQLSAGEAFLLGMFSRTIATLVVFPFVRAKVRMQKLTSSSTEARNTQVSSPPNIWKLLSENYTDGGLKALYQGLGPELTRGVLSAALMMMVKERISGAVKLILHGDRP